MKELRIGDTATVSRTITEGQVYEFAALTGDYNRIHVDKQWAEQQRFGQRIAHGLFVNSLIGPVMGLDLPGNGCIFMGVNVQFKAPTFFGDTVEVKVEFTSYEEKTKCYIGMFTNTITNQRGEVVIIAEAMQMLPKTHFIIK